MLVSPVYFLAIYSSMDMAIKDEGKIFAKILKDVWRVSQPMDLILYVQGGPYACYELAGRLRP